MRARVGVVCVTAFIAWVGIITLLHYGGVNTNNAYKTLSTQAPRLTAESRRLLQELPSSLPSGPIQSNHDYISNSTDNWVIDFAQLLYDYRLNVLRVSASGESLPPIFPYPPTHAYAQSIGFNMAPGILVGVIFWIAGIIFYCVRCCRCCGMRSEVPRTWSKAQRWCPYLWLVIFTLLTFGAIFVLKQSNATFHEGLREAVAIPTNVANTVMSTTNSMATQLTQIASALTSTGAHIQQLLSSTQSIPPLVQSSAANVDHATQLFSTSANTLTNVAQNVTSLRSLLQQLASSGVPNTPSPSLIPAISPSVLSEMTQAQNAADTASQDAQQVVAQVTAAVHEVVNAPVQQRMQQIASQVSGYAQTIVDVGAQVPAAVEIVSVYNTTILNVEDTRYRSTIAIAVIIVLLFLFALLGFLQRCGYFALPQCSSCCLGVGSFCMIFFTMSLFGVFFGFGIASGDACTTFVPTMWSQIGGVPPLALDALNCTSTDNFFALANLKSLFNVTTYIGAASLPSIPDLANSISPATEAPVLQQLAAFVDTSFESLVSTTQINNTITELTSFQDGLSVSDFGGDQAQYQQAMQNLARGISALQAITPSLISVDSNNVQVNASVAVVLDQLQQAQNQVQTTLQNVSLATSVLGDIQIDLNTLYSLGGCGYYGESYRNLTSLLCNDVNAGAVVMWFAFLALSTFLFAAIFLGVIGSTRYGRPHRQSYRASLTLDTNGAIMHPLLPTSKRPPQILPPSPVPKYVTRASTQYAPPKPLAPTAPPAHSQYDPPPPVNQPHAQAGVGTRAAPTPAVDPIYPPLADLHPETQPLMRHHPDTQRPR